MKDRSLEARESLPNDHVPGFYGNAESPRYERMRNFRRIAGVISLTALFSGGLYVAGTTAMNLLETERWGVPIKDGVEDFPQPIVIETTTTTQACTIELLPLPPTPTKGEILTAIRECNEESGFETLEAMNEQARTANSSPRS